MGYWVNAQGNYYEGDRANLNDLSVSQRPGPNYQWANNAWVAVAVMPDVVYSWQLRRALSQQGIRAAVEAAIIGSSQDIQDMWQFATEYHRNHPMVAEIAAAIGKTEADIDALFILAGSIT